jgi:hypothetical protein
MVDWCADKPPYSPSDVRARCSSHVWKADCGQIEQRRAQRESFLALTSADADKLALTLGEAAEHGHLAPTVSSVFSLNSILSGISVIA